MVMSTQNKFLMAMVWAAVAIFLFFVISSEKPEVTVVMEKPAIVDFSDVYAVVDNKIDIGNGVVLTKDEFKRAVILGTEVLNKKPELVAKVTTPHKMVVGNEYSIAPEPVVVPLKHAIALDKQEIYMLELYNRYRGFPFVRNAINIIYQKQNDGEFMDRLVKKVENWTKDNK
jgi:hypothetical protein